MVDESLGEYKLALEGYFESKLVLFVVSDGGTRRIRETFNRR
jgi:hypothetical protein